MKTKLLLAVAVVSFMLSSCTKESELDAAITSAINAQTEIEFTTYASSATSTKGVAVNSNSDFQDTEKSYGSFKVGALVSDGDFNISYYDSVDEAVADDKTLWYTIKSYYATPIANDVAVDYFGFNTVNYTNGKWTNGTKMYWPNYDKIIHLAAYSPADIKFFGDDVTSPTFSMNVSSDTIEIYNYSIPYSVDSDIEKQVDLMYAMTSVDYLDPSDKTKDTSIEGNSDDSYITTGVGETNEEESINLHFKHALTQIAFTATKDSDIDVYVKSLTICNVYNSGTFKVTTLTDDVDADATTNPTVGENGNTTGDTVNTDNFGEWTTDFSGSWGNLYTESESNAERLYYYTTTGHSSMSNYSATLAEPDTKSPNAGDDVTDKNSIMLGSDAKPLTASDDVLMLMPQQLTAWVPTTSTVLNYVGFIYGADTEGTLVQELDDEEQASSTSTNSLSYLAIDCEIYHVGINNPDAKIHDGYIFVPFETKNIAYSSATNVDSAAANADKWLPGYKITYCLNFGGGYIVEEGDHETIPLPGCIPDTETYTLRTITYTTTVDAWIDGADHSQDLEEYETGVIADEN